MAKKQGMKTADAQRDGLDKSLAKTGERIVKMTDVTVTKDSLTKAIVKSGNIPGNEVPAFGEFILREVIVNG